VHSNQWYDKVLADAYDRHITQALEYHMQMLADLGALRTHLPGEIECSVNHEEWFDSHPDKPCPGCRAAL
jgi:hypothetical protein